MGSEGLAGGGRQCSGPFRWLGGIGRSRGDRARLADRHFTFCRVGGGSRGNGFLQGKKTRPRGGEAQPSCRCCLAGGRAADAAGPSQVTQRPRAWPRGGARGGGVRARASAYKRAAQPFVPARGARATAPPLQLLFCSVCARPLIMSFIHAQLCLGLPGLGRCSAQGFPTAVSFSRPFPPLSP